LLKQKNARRAGAEVSQLTACINDLVGIVALPAIWKGAAPSEIIRTLLDMLLRILPLEFVFLRLKDPVEKSSSSVLRVAHSHTVTVQTEEIEEMLKGWCESHFQKVPRLVENPFGEGQLSIVSTPLGLDGEIGVLVAGSRREDFPARTERLLLNVAANQLAIGLQEAWLSNEQKRVAEELDRRVTQKTEELAEANKELKNRERRIGRLIDSNIIGIVIWDLDGRVIDANDAFLRMVRYEREDLEVGLRWLDMTPPEWQEAHARYEAEELKATGKMQAREKEYFRKDGSRVPVLIGAACFEDQPDRGVAYILDLSEQKRVEEALRRSQAYLAEAQRLTHTGSCAIDGASHEAAFWSDEMFRLFDFDPKQGPPKWNQFLEQIHPDDRNKVRLANERTFRTKANCDVEFRVLKHDGTVQHIHGVGHPVVSPTGELVHVLGTMVDVTESKQAEEERERLRQAHRVVVETASDAVVSADENGAIQFANPATTRVFGYDPKELIGKPLTILMPKFMRKLHDNGFKRYLATGQRHMNWQGTELIGLRKNGQEFPVEISFGELTMNGHRVFTGFIRDITEKKQAEEERERLRRVQADLARMARVSTMGELTASLAHEIRQPLTAALANAETCLDWLGRENPDIKEGCEAAAHVVTDVNRAADIISSVSALFKKGALRREPVDANDVIREMVSLLRNEAQSHSVIIRTELAENIPTVNADRLQLQQVFMNLMLNGIDAMKSVTETGELSIKSESADDQLLISVTDAGIGLPPDHEDRIFKAFFTTKQGGTGMGLSISRSIVESHGGRLWATANSNKGATFRFTLPAVSPTREG